MKLLYTLVFMLTLSTYNVKAQAVTKKHSTHVFYASNVKAPLTAKELKMLKDVYADQLDKEVLNRPQRLKDIKNILRNRVEIVDYNNKDLSSMVKLSSIPLFNIYNKALTRDAFFSPENFNVLKYNLPFYIKKRVTYHIDNSTYILSIIPQHEQ